MKKIIVKNASWEVIKEFEQDINKTLISQMRDADLNVLSACHHWICWACIYKVNNGWENIIKDFKWSPWFPLWDDEVMTCIAWLQDSNSENIELQENSL